MDIWDYFKNLFQKAEESSPSNPLIREAIERRDEEIEAYELWKRTLSKQRLLDWIRNEYLTFLATPTKLSKDIGILNTPSSKGFVLHFDELRHNNKDFAYLFDYLKERVLIVGYRKYMSDRRSYTQKKWVEVVERHYLKPALQWTKEKNKLKQVYGNITIELLFQNDVIINLKFQATHYNDRMFTSVEDFKELMWHLTE